MKLKYLILISIFTFGLTSCDFDLQQSPNALTPDLADPDFVLNSVEFGLNEYFFDVTDYTMETTRMLAMEPRGNSYAVAYQPVDFDDTWEMAYTGILADAKTLIPLAEDKGLFVHAGIARVAQAYVLMSLVDVFGDVPWSAALDGTNFNPATDDGASVYTAAEGLLDAAIADFAKEALGTPKNDLFYGGDAASWTSLANSLKLRLYLNTGDKSGIDRLITNGSNFVTPATDWDYPFSSNQANPDSRHPYFGDSYKGDGAEDYQSNYFMALLKDGKSVRDPRLRYYFFRQVTDYPDPADPNTANEYPCWGNQESVPSHYTPGMAFCTIGEGYWGRDHLDNDGIPPDNLLRTAFGLYPIGGAFDADAGGAINGAAGIQGAGIHPLMNSSSVKFMLAEAAVSMTTAGDPRMMLEQGMRESIDKVMNFAPGAVDAAFAPTAEDVDAYVAEVLANYDGAGTTKEKLNVIGTEHYISLFGNGLEAYNLYRRTSAPNNVQFTLSATPGSFIRSFPYPSNAINRNSSISSKGDVGVKVFWDTNPDDLK